MKRILPAIEVHAGVDMMGFDFYVTAIVEISDDGCPSTWTDPADPAEFYPVEIILQTDEPNVLGPEWSIEPGTAQWELLETILRDKISEDVYSDINKRRFIRRYSTRSRGDCDRWLYND